MKYTILTLSLAAFIPTMAHAETPGLNHNVILSGPIYGGGVSKAQQRLGLGSLNDDINVGSKRSKRSKFGFTRKTKKR